MANFELKSECFCLRFFMFSSISVQICCAIFFPSISVAIFLFTLYSLDEINNYSIKKKKKLTSFQTKMGLQKFIFHLTFNIYLPHR